MYFDVTAAVRAVITLLGVQCSGVLRVLRVLDRVTAGASLAIERV